MVRRGPAIIRDYARDVLAILLVAILSGCVTGIRPRELRGIASEKVTLSQVVKDPEAYKGKVVLWGGKVIRAINRKDGTMIEVLKLPLDTSDRPRDVDTSNGRFLALYPGYLDIAIYRPGREITVIGEIQGVKKMPLGEIRYSYPFLKIKKIHLWKTRPEPVRASPPYPYWWYGPPCLPWWYGWYPY